MDTAVVHGIEDPADVLHLYGTRRWFTGRDAEDVRRSLAGSDEVVGLRDAESGRLVASGRVITDYVSTGKVLDAIVDEPLRGQDLGRQLTNAITGHPALQDLDELTPHCRDGVATFYEAYGFEVHEMIGDDRDGYGEDYYVMVYS